MAATANNVLATPATVAAATPAARVTPNAHKYANNGANPRAVATRAVSYALTAHGQATAAVGVGKAGKPTVMALVAVAANVAIANNGGNPVTGLQIVAAMRANAYVKAAYANTKAGKYAPAGTLPCPAWCSGYVAGAARAAAGLLTAVTA